MGRLLTMRPKHKRYAKIRILPRRLNIPITILDIQQEGVAVYKSPPSPVPVSSKKKKEIIIQQRKKLLELYREQQSKNQTKRTSTAQTTEETNTDNGGVWPPFGKFKS